MNLMFTAVTFVAFTALVAVISWWKTRGDNLGTQEGYYLAGRNLTGPVIAGSLLMTNLSAEQLVGNNGQAVRIGSDFGDCAGHSGLCVDAEIPENRSDHDSRIF